MSFYRAAFLISLGLFSASYSAAQSKGTFQAAISTSAGPATIPSNTGFLLGGISPIQGITGDFNDDGKADAVYLASCSQGSSNGQYGIPNCPAFNGSVVATYLGNGDGTFQPAIVSAGPAQGARSMAAGDFNGDGMMDVVTVSDCNPTDCTSGLLTIMQGKGDGTFTAVASYPVNGAVIGANTITTGDLNGDGKQDIVIGLGCDFSNSGCSTGAVLVFLGNGDGTFQTPKDYPTVGNQALPVVVGDFNKDGKQDVLLSNFVSPGGGSLIFFPGNGDGTLGTSVSTPLPGFVGGTALAVADFNSDGNLDAVTIGASVAVAFGNGDGTFQSPTMYSLAITVAEFPQNIVATDMNGDGKPDIVVGEGQGGGLNAVGVLLNDGTGNFSNIANYTMGGTNTASAAVADFNGDGKNDILLASSIATTANDDGAVSLLLGNGDGTFRSVQYVSVPGIGANTNAVAAADFNGDGFQDLVLPVGFDAGFPSGFALSLSDGAGGYQAPLTFTTSSASGGQMIAVGDFNADGKPDVAVLNSCDATCAGPSLSVFLNTGNGTFGDGVVYEIGGSTPLAVVTGDFKGNGKLDIAILNQCYTSSCGGQGSVAVLLGNGDGTFQPVITTPTNGLNGVYWLAAADLNHDGLTDLVVTEDDADNANDASATAAQILMSNGDGTFTLGGNYLTGGDRGLGATVAIGDVNSDGIPDIVAANNCDSIVGDVNCARGLISVLLGNGNGTFQPATTIAVPDSNFDGVSFADVNADGKLDIVASTGQGIAVFWGNGDGTFQNPTNYSGGATIQNSQLALADLRNDGGLDIVQPSYLGQLTIFYNQGFALPSSTTTMQSSANPSTYGQSITFTATVTSTSGTPTGTVTFTVDGAPAGSFALSGGSASITILLNVGAHSIAASYGGDTDHSASNSAALPQVVNPSTTTTVVTSSANPSYVTQTVTYTATVTAQYPGYVKGSITFKDGTTVLEGIILTGSFATGGGSVQLAEQYNSKGTHSITATYSGDGNNIGSTSATLKQTVDALPATTKITMTSSGTPSLINQSVTFTAAVTSTFGPIPDGELVTFLNGTTILATVPLASGTATYSTSILKAGTSAISVKYPGDADFKASTAIVKQVVSLYSSSTSTPASSLNPSNFGQAVTFTATVTSTAPSTPTGTVTFKNGATSLATVTLDASGIATLTRTNFPLGSLSITPSYNGDSETAKSTCLPLTQAVNQAQTTMTLTSTPNPSALGASVKFTATLASNGGVPTGTVTFTSGATTLGTATIANGKATFLTKTLPQGADQITATYAGNADYSPANASETQQVN